MHSAQFVTGLAQFRPYVMLVACLALQTGFSSPEGAQNATNPICVMTYNLRYSTGDNGTTNAWVYRRPMMKELILKVSPDLIGTQEGLFEQLKEVASDLPGYKWIGTGRDGGNKGEFSAIFYKPSRFEPIQTNQFWLSDTPEVAASSSWGNVCRRMVNWVKFRDLQTGKEFYQFNTHFDNDVQVAREKSTQLIRARVEALHTELPVILTGDFNAPANDKVHDLLTANGFFSDTWEAAKIRRGEGLGTFNGFSAVPKEDQRIDWILSRGEVSTEAEEIVTFSKGGRFPSDHCPLVGWIRLGK